MAHTIHKTPGFVLAVRAAGEVNELMHVFTEAVGVVWVSVRASKKVESKLRYHVQPFSYGDYALVRGREVWRLTGAKEEVNYFYALRDDRTRLLVLERYTRLLRRLLAEEVAHPELFGLLTDGFALLNDKALSAEQVANLEYLLVLRTLLALGYVGEHATLREMLTLSPITIDMLRRVSPLRKAAVLEINRALRESQL